MKWYLLIFSLTGLLVGCSDDSEEVTSTVGDTLVIEKVDTVLSDATKEGLDQLTSKYRPSRIDPDWSSFRMINTWKEDSLIESKYTPGRAERFSRLLKYSPDSSMILDMDSYNLETDGDGRFVPAGPDTEISLINTKTGMRRRLLFFGPGSSVEEAFWQDNDNIVMIGVREGDRPSQKIASIWRYHLPTSDFYYYESSRLDMPELFEDWGRRRLNKSVP